MFEVNERIAIPEDEFDWTYARAGGPGGQNVNKVSSKAVLHWNLAANATLPPEVKQRLIGLHRRRVTKEGLFVISSQRFRDQDKNRTDCLDKLREMVVEATFVPKPRKATKPSRGSKERRLKAKQHRSETKAGRRGPVED